jgi:glycosyltransferase involved in cell wall biosynthesis
VAEGTTPAAPPRVLHVLEALEGGTARHLVDVVRHAKGTAHEVVIPVERIGGVTDEAAEGHLREAGATVHHLGMRRTPWSPANAAALVRLARLVRRVEPDVVHGHSSIGGLLARLAAAGTGRPRVYTPNGVTDVRAGRWVERALAPLTDRVVAVSTSEAATVVDLHLAAADRVATIPNGIDLEPAARIDLRSRLGIGAGVPLVGSIARLVPQKAPLDLVAAAAAVRAEVPEARFVLVGDGALAGEVDAAVRTAGLEGVLQRIPVLPGAAGLLADLDVFLLTSRFEGGPYAPLEAMREGAAVVLTDVVGSRDAVEDGRTGLLVPPGEPAAAAAAVVGLLRDPARRASLISAARERVAQRFDVRAMGAAHDALYADLTRSSRRARKGAPS